MTRDKPVEQPSPTYEYPHEEARRAAENGAPIIESMTITVNTNDTRDKESIPENTDLIKSDDEAVLGSRRKR